MVDQNNYKKSGISVVLGTYNRKIFLKLAVESIRQELQNASFPHEIIIIDGGSTDDTISWLVSQKDIISIIQHNRGTWKGEKIQRKSWGYFMNLGFKCAQFKYICMLSDDCLVVPGTIRNGYDFFEKELSKGSNIGAVAFYWRNWPEQEKYWVGLTLGNKMFVNHGMYQNRAIAEVGYVDEEHYTFYHADADLCLKLWQNGYSVIDSPDSYIEHYGHANRGVRKSNLKGEKQDNDNYLKKWEGIFYYPSNPVRGSWIEKPFHDSAEIFTRFQKPGVEKLSAKIFRSIYTLKDRIFHD